MSNKNPGFNRGLYQVFMFSLRRHYPDQIIKRMFSGYETTAKT